MPITITVETVTSQMCSRSAVSRVSVVNDLASIESSSAVRM